MSFPSSSVGAILWTQVPVGTQGDHSSDGYVQSTTFVSMLCSLAHSLNHSHAGFTQKGSNARPHSETLCSMAPKQRHQVAEKLGFLAAVDSASPVGAMASLCTLAGNTSLPPALAFTIPPVPGASSCTQISSQRKSALERG